MRCLDMLDLHGRRGSHGGGHMPVGTGTGTGTEAEYTLVAIRVVLGHYT